MIDWKARLTDAQVVVKRMHDFGYHKLNARNANGKVFKAALRVQDDIDLLISCMPDPNDHSTRDTALLERLYMHFADVRCEWPGRNTLEGQRLLIDMRDSIAKAKGRDPMWVQDNYGVAKLRAGVPV